MVSRLLLLLLAGVSSTLGYQPLQENEVRERRSLEGLWSFVREPSNGGDIGLAAKWNAMDISSFANASVMPVPSAYNDLGDGELRDHWGWVWYQKFETIPQRVKGVQRVFLRLESVSNYAIVFLNSREVIRHEGGHLPFEVELTDALLYDRPNKFSIAVNNTLSWDTVPQADFVYSARKAVNVSGTPTFLYPPGHFTVTPVMDFFNYAGILRPINLLFRPRTFIDYFDIKAHQNGSFSYSLTLNGSDAESLKCEVEILDASGKKVFSSADLNGTGTVADVRLWWPRGLGEPHLYTIQARLVKKDHGGLVDAFRTSFGFRTVTWNEEGVYFNGRRFYCVGVGWHEESAIRGRSFDRVIMAKDLALFDWLGVNCFRSTHYPYADETIFEADRRGIAVIVEAPSVGVTHHSEIGKVKHAERIREMIAQNSRHPAVFMWSVANEPFSFVKGSREYFQPLIKLAQTLDGSRPVTLVHGQAQYSNDLVSDLLDVICVNRYYGWYRNLGDLDHIGHLLEVDLRMWKQTYKKPIFFTEYGAENIPGVLSEPSSVFSTQYQEAILQKTHEALDRLREDGIIEGELAWVFADFMTHQSLTRIGGNHKGLFTRDRQAKQAAYIIKDRYHHILEGHSGNATSSKRA